MSAPAPAAPPRKGSPLVGFAVGCALALVGGFALLALDEEGASEPGLGDPDVAAAEAPGAPDAPLAPYGIRELARDSFPASGPVTVRLALPGPAAGAGPRPVRVISQGDERVLATEAPPSAEGGSATVAVDPAFLEPGTYLIEVETGEPAHPEPRRYVLVVH